MTNHEASYVHECLLNEAIASIVSYGCYWNDSISRTYRSTLIKTLAEDKK